MIDEKKAQILRMEDCIDDMLYDLRNGLEKGSTTHIKNIDDCWKWRRGEVNIWTGYQNEGKSEFIRFLCVIKSLVDGWKFIFSAPEDFPAKTFYDSMLHTLCGQSTDRDNPNFVKEAKYLAAYELLKNNFYFVYAKPPHNTIGIILNEFEEHIAKEGISGAIIDPLIKHARPKDISDRDDLYAAFTTTQLTDFARRTNTSTHLVMHQVTPKPMESGLYSKPSPYAIKGGGTWSDGVDNVLYIHRPKYATDKFDPAVTFGSQKIKRHKLVAVPQDFKMSFDRRTNRYTGESGEELFNFSKYLK